MVLLMLQCVLGLAAHDVILKVNGDEIEAKVTDIGLTEIKYKRASNLTGPTYTLPISDIFMITYENGEKDVFGRSRNTATASATTTTPVASATTAAAATTSTIPQAATNYDSGTTASTATTLAAETNYTPSATTATAPEAATNYAASASTPPAATTTGQSEWTIFRTSNKEVIYTVKALIPENAWDY